MKLGLFVLAAMGASLPAAAPAQRHPGAHASAGPVIRHVGPPARMEMHRRGPIGPGAHFVQRRFGRGFIIPPVFVAPQYHVQNWRLYGFAPPPAGHRWIRHHDDAYLIDGGGRVRDYRYGLDWDRYGEDWDLGAPDYVEGPPPYHGPGDHDRYDDSDFADFADFDDDHHRRGGHDGHHGPDCGECAQRVRVRTVGPVGHPAPYGYGYGWGQPIIVETTVTTGAPTVTTEIIEEVVETRRRPVRRHHRPRAVRPSKLVGGERG